MNELEKLKLDFLTGIAILKSGLFNNNSEIIFKNIQIWKEVLQIVDVEERHYIDTYQELLDKLKEDPEHIKTFYEDFEICVNDLEKNVELYKGDQLSESAKSYAWANITLPIPLLSVMWIHNHPKYKGDLYEFSETEHFEPLREVLQGGDEND